MRKIILLVAAMALTVVLVGGVTWAQEEEVPTCWGMPATIVGDADGDGYIAGTEGDDVIVGTSAREEIYGYGGNDRICAGYNPSSNPPVDYKEAVSGGSGNDRIDGQTGSDYLLGDDGNDIVYGGSHIDSVQGNRGQDTMKGGKGDDTLGDLPADNRGDDTLVGGPGDDYMRDWDATDDGYVDVDKLSGGDGDDLLYARDYDSGDTVDGGAHVSVGDECWNDYAPYADVLQNCER